MKKIFLVVVAFMAITAATAQNCTPPQDYVEVRGVAKAMVDPNKAEISVTLNQADSKGKITMAELEGQLAKALKDAGVDASKQLVLVNQTSEAQKRDKAYQFKSYILTVYSATEAQNVFNVFADNGVKNATITKIWNDKQDEIQEKLKIEAMLNAQNTAKALTGAIGQTIGTAIQITDYSYNEDALLVNNFSVRSKSADTAGVESLPSMDFKKIKIERSVTVRFLLNK